MNAHEYNDLIIKAIGMLVALLKDVPPNERKEWMEYLRVLSAVKWNEPGSD